MSLDLDAIQRIREALAEATYPVTFSRGRWTIRLVRRPRVSRRGLELVVQVFRDGELLPLDNPVCLPNPRLLAPGAGTRQVTLPGGRTVTVAQLEEKPLLALAAQLLNLVEVD